MPSGKTVWPQAEQNFLRTARRRLQRPVRSNSSNLCHLFLSKPLQKRFGRRSKFHPRARSCQEKGGLWEWRSTNVSFLYYGSSGSFALPASLVRRFLHISFSVYYCIILQCIQCPDLILWMNYSTNDARLVNVREWSRRDIHRGLPLLILRFGVKRIARI